MMTSLKCRGVRFTGFEGATPHGRIHRVKILDMHVALWRGSTGAIHCVTDECPVTGSILSDGSTVTRVDSDGTAHELITSRDGTVTYDAISGQLLMTADSSVRVGKSSAGVLVATSSTEPTTIASVEAPCLEVCLGYFLVKYTQRRGVTYCDVL